MKRFTKLFLFLLMQIIASYGWAQSFNVTFSVDMSQYVGLNDTVYVNGTWNNWCGRCNPLTKVGSTNVWSGTISIPSGSQEFKYTVGGWNAQEALTSGSSCTVTNGGFTNRSINVTANTTIPTVCWNSCSACNSLIQMDLPITFDSSIVNYALVDFGGDSSYITADPVVSSNKVSKTVKTATAELWAGTTIGTTAGFKTAIPFASNANTMTLRVYSPDSGIVVKLKAEDANDAAKSVETDVKTTTKNAWETLTFDFSKQATGTAAINYTYSYKKASVFFNFGVTGAIAGRKVYYFDDLKFIAPPAPTNIPMDLPVTFDSSIVDYVLADFGGDSSYITVDPVVSSNKVVKTVKTATAELWAGTTIGSATGFTNAIPFTANSNKMTLRVFSPDTGIIVKLKAEDANDGSKSVETDVKTTTKNAWETLTFDFSKQSTGTAAINYTYSYKKASVFFNFGVTGATAGRKVYYFDDLKFVAPIGPVFKDVALPIYFDSTNINYVFTDFGGNASSLDVDPKNSANKVAKSIKSNTAELWAGTTMSGAAGLGAVIPFTASANTIKMKVYSPDSGIIVKLKAEDPNDATKSVETDVKTTTINAWETLTFDFSKEATGTAKINYAYTYKKLSVFFNFGITGATAGTKTYYWDNVEFASIAPPPPPAKVNVTFSVDVKSLNLAATDTVTLNGTFNGWCGACNKMTKVPGKDIWTTTLALDTNKEIEYKFTVGNWVKQETLSPSLSCTKTTGTFTNRLYKTKATNDSLGLVCWETCGPCINGGPLKTKVTFKVDMKDYAKDLSKGVTINGTFNGWCGNCNTMTLIGNKIYSIDLIADTGDHEFKFTVGNWDDQEQFSPSDSCTKTTGTFTNRFFHIKDTNTMVVGPYCWNTCSTCSVTGLKDEWLTRLKIYPNPAIDHLKIDLGSLMHKPIQVDMYNTIGELVLQKSYNAMDAGVQDMDVHFLSKGIYLIRISSDQSVRTVKFQLD